MQPGSKSTFLLKKSYLVDLLIVKNLPILSSFWEVLVFGSITDGIVNEMIMHT